ncbi:hypothetical protein M0805_002626 [Coniferiporia weirii]|nr:hypothetical protein M0805_002626 [Coniferiporia weirii]
MSQNSRRLTYVRSTSGLSSKGAGTARSAGSEKVYYRLLTYNAPYNSNYPIDAEDDALSFLHANRIPPPGFAADYVHYICNRENIHPSRAKIYTSTPTRSAYVYSSHLSVHGRTRTLPDDPAFTLVAPDMPVCLQAGGCGSARTNPLVLFLDLDPSMDRTHAALPAGKLERGGRRVAKVVSKGYGAVQSFFFVCFGTLQKVPKGME